MSIKLFPQIERETLEEDAKDNYEFYTGIALDIEHNNFKIITGKYKDKKDMYYKLRKRGLSMRKCYEKKCWDWIEDNAKTALDGYLMYSTAVSKWRNNNMLAEYYVKLMNDIPSLNRERQKGNPNTRGPAKKGWKEALINGMQDKFPLKEEDNKPFTRWKSGDIDYSNTSKHTVQIYPLEAVKDEEGNTLYNKKEIKNTDGTTSTVDDTRNPVTKRMAAFDPDQGGRAVVLNNVALPNKQGNNKFDNPLIYETIFGIEHGKFSKLNSKGEYQNPFGLHPSVEKEKLAYLEQKPEGISDEDWLKNAPEDIRRKFSKVAYPIAYEVVLDDAEHGDILRGSELRNMYNQRMHNKDYPWLPRANPTKQLGAQLQVKNRTIQGLNNAIKTYKTRSKDAYSTGDTEKGWKNILLAQRGKDYKVPTVDDFNDLLKNYTDVATSVHPVNNLTKEEYEELERLRGETVALNYKIRDYKTGKLKATPEEIEALRQEYNKTRDKYTDVLNNFKNRVEDKLNTPDSFENIAKYASTRDIAPSSMMHGGDSFGNFAASLDRKHKLEKMLAIKKAGGKIYKDDNGNFTTTKPKDKDTWHKRPKSHRTYKKPGEKLSLEQQLQNEVRDLEKNKKDFETIRPGTHDWAYLKDRIARQEKNIEALKHIIGNQSEAAVNDGVDTAYKAQAPGGITVSKGAVLNLGGIFHEDSDIEEAYTKYDLNQLLFDGTDLKPEVRVALLKIAKLFKESLDVDFEPVDVYFTGSSANYNFTDQSDIDLHLVYDYENVGVNAELLNAYFVAAKQNFNTNYDIKVKGFPVEVGCENLQEPLMAGGIYSILRGEWVKKPTAKEIEIPDIDMLAYHELVGKIEDAIQGRNPKTIAALWKEIGKMRKESLKAEGEYGKGNTLFKKLRNLGYLKRLKDAYYINKSEEMSLESLEEM